MSYQPGYFPAVYFAPAYFSPDLFPEASPSGPVAPPAPSPGESAPPGAYATADYLAAASAWAAQAAANPPGLQPGYFPADHFGPAYFSADLFPLAFAEPASTALLATVGPEAFALLTRGMGETFFRLGLAGSTAPATFLTALMDYLDGVPAIVAELGGAPRVYVERATTNAVAPYVLVEGIREIPGDTDDESVVSLEVNAYAPTAAAARRLGRLIMDALDPPALNPRSTRARLEWAGGIEETAIRGNGHEPYRIPGGATGIRANWARIIPYEFTIRLDGSAQVTPDAPFVPATLAPDLPRALEAYLTASAPLAALLGGPGKVYADLTTASADTRPFVLVEKPEDDPGGEADEDGLVKLSVVVQARSLRAASAVHSLLCDLIDPPALSRTGRRGAPLEWDGGRETSAWRVSSTAQLLDGVGPGGADVWSWSADYEFRTVATG